MSAASDSGPHAIAFPAADGLVLRGDAWGEAENPPVLLLHGGGQTRHAWRSTAARLSRAGWYAIALDARGHGETGWTPDRQYRFDDYVADLRGVAARLGTRPVVIGASLGGLTGLLAEGESPESVLSALILVDIAPRIELSGRERIYQFMKSGEHGFASIEEAVQAVAAYLPHRRRTAGGNGGSNGLARNLRTGPDGRLYWHWDPRMLEDLQQYHPTRERLERAARQLRIPVMLVRGGLSDVVSEEAAREFLDLVAHARYVDISGAAHMVAGDDNDAFSAAMLPFLVELQAA